MKRTIIALTLSLYLSVTPISNDRPVTWISNKEFKCLADNVYFEARGEPDRGQVAVARVTLNRAKNTSICTEVYKYKQFSWTLYKNNKILDAEAYAEAKINAVKAIDFQFPATHFHAVSVRPVWAKQFKRIAQIGNHVFYVQV